MNENTLKNLTAFLSVIGLDEGPMGIFYTDEKPNEGFSPKPCDLPTREKEMKNEVNWQEVFGNFSCAMGHIWRARKKQVAAYFFAEQFGCTGGSFWMGYTKPMPETIINYVSTGIPNMTEGERYCDSPGALRQIFEYVDPRPAPKKYCVIKPVCQFSKNEVPELVTFFARPESLCGIHQLAAFVTNDPEVVVSPWGAGCGSLIVWPLHYLSKGMNKAAVGGWDPSARKFFKTDELTFTLPFQMFTDMLNCYTDSFLATKNWKIVQKKIARSNQAWK